jgi:hypothetical protein
MTAPVVGVGLGGALAHAETTIASAAVASA